MGEKLGIYIHIPFCVRKCAYCDFYSMSINYGLASAYTSKIIDELSRWGGILKCPPADTLYFGGGTPSLLKPEQISAIIEKATEVFFLKDAEITLEVNPAENLSDYFKCIKKSGVNRLSIGLQSAVEGELEILSRRHTPNDVIKCVADAKNAGINNISLDIMLGIPNQTEKSLKYTVDFATKLNPTHISAYLLTLEEGTPLYKNRENLHIPNEDEAGELYLLACRLLSDSGYERYEISNFARENNISRHNTKYWKGADYLGLGPAAHSLIKGNRFYYERDLEGYLNNPKEIWDGKGGTIDEKVMLNLRLKSGLNTQSLLSEFPNDIDQNKFADLIKMAELFSKNGLVRFNKGIISLTDRGALVSNGIIAKFLEQLK